MLLDPSLNPPKLMRKILATIDSALNEQDWRSILLAQGWKMDYDANQHSVFRYDAIEINLEGDGFTLLFGNLHTDAEPTALLELLHEHADQFNCEIFEEDGRLVQKITG